MSNDNVKPLIIHNNTHNWYTIIIKPLYTHVVQYIMSVYMSNDNNQVYHFLQYLSLMLVAICFSPIVSNADTNDNQQGPPLTSLTLSSPFNQADIQSRKHFTGSPLFFSSMSTSLGSYSPNCRPRSCHTEQDKCWVDVNSLMMISRSLISIQ